MFSVLRSIPTFFFVIPFALSASHAQNTGAALGSLKSTLEGKRFFPVDFNGDDTIRWHWSGGTFTQDTPSVRIFALLQVNHLSLKKSTLTITATRHEILRHEDGSFAPSGLTEHVKEEVDLTGADLPAALSTLPDVLFFKDSAAATHALPAGLITALPPKVDGSGKYLKEQTKPPTTCDCNDLGKPACGDATDFLSTMRGVSVPKLVHAVDPEFSEEARQQEFDGSVQVRLTIDEQGKPQNIWITHSVGKGLDSKAVDAVKQYRFKPAMCHEKPVPVSLFIDVNFQVR